MTIEINQTITTYPADVHTPIGLYLRFVGKDNGILLESAEVDGRLGRYSLLAWDFRLQLKLKNGKMEVKAYDPKFSNIEKFKGQDFFKAIKEILKIISIKPSEQNLPPITRSLIGYIGYECIGLFEPKLQSHMDINDAESIFVLPGKQILYDHLHLKCYYISIDGEKLTEAKDKINLNAKHKIGKVHSSFKEEEFIMVVKQTKDLIYQGEAIQVVLSNRFSSEFSGEPFSVYRGLRQTNPSPYMFFMNLEDITLIGSSPELMVRCQNDIVEVRPIAGTRKRGKTELEDKKLAIDLINDPKERAEHVMLVDLGRNDLGRIAAPGSVEVSKFMEIERFSHVIHLTSYVVARLKEGLDAIDVICATFPAGTVSGAPKIRAMEIISQMEKIPRGPYAGAVGWLGVSQERHFLDTGIIIRSLWIRNSKVFWQAGAGIVADSKPENEWIECHNKAKVIYQILTNGGGTDVFANR